ncbi:MAG: FG-GAP repeat protein [Phycisphaerales bacterium]
MGRRPLTDDGDDENGSAYVFDPSNTTQLNTFTADDVFDSFGLYGLDISVTNSAVMIGAPGFSGGGKVFVYNPLTFSFFTSLERDTTTDDFNYGWKVEHNDQYLVVSAKGEFDFSPDGAVYVYDFASGFLLYRLTSPIEDLDGGDEFGIQIALENDTLLVSFGGGAPSDVRAKVAMYDLTTGDLVTLLDADATTNQDGFGSSISIEGNTAVIGAPFTNDPRLPGKAGELRGALYVYDLSTKTQTEKIMLPTSVTDRKAFGSPAVIKDGTIVTSSGTDVISENRSYVIKQFCKPDLNLDGNLNFFDVSFFLAQSVDWKQDGSFNFLDISAFLQSFNDGCP